MRGREGQFRHGAARIVSEVRFHASDGQILSGRHFPCALPRGAVLLCGATGVRQRFYWHFAQWLTERSYAVLTFDYRGLGESLREGHVRNSPARKQDWGELDMPAALDWLEGQYPQQPLHLIGHSAGGQLIGLMYNHRKLTRVVQVASSSGYVGNIRMPLRLAARVLLSVYIPLCARLLGYVPTKRIGWGEDLPAQVARQWAQWCLRPGYVSNGFGRDVRRHYYGEVSTPILSIAAADDPIATEANITDLLRLFPAAPVRRITIEPRRWEKKAVGHIEIFRPRNMELWPVIAEGLQ
jgi:predicted alpha/beta hydrolase